MATQAESWAGIPKVARWTLSGCSKSIDYFVAHNAPCNTWSSGGTSQCRMRGATSKLDLRSRTPLSVAVCGLLQLGVPHLIASVDY